MKIIQIAFALTLFNQMFAQETFPLNGVEENFDPIYAFTNANIISQPGVEFKNSTLIIQGNKILKLDSNLNIPEGAIVYDLKGNTSSDQVNKLISKIPNITDETIFITDQEVLIKLFLYLRIYNSCEFAK